MATKEELLARLEAAEARLAAVEGGYPSAKYFNTRFVSGLAPTANQVPLWDGNRIKFVPTTLVPGTGLPAWATTEIADVAATEAAGTGTVIPRPDHVHAHGSGYLADAHHAQSHSHVSHTGVGANDHHAQLHQAAHNSGGGDALKLDVLAAPTDITTLNATTALHGLLPKLGGGTTNFLRADGTWDAPTGGGMKPLITMHPGSVNSIGVDLAAFAVAAPASGTFTATRTLYVPFAISESLTVAQVFWYNGATVGGGREVDCGVMNESGVRQLSSTSTVTAGANAIQSVDINPDVTLAAGRYYLALSDNATAATFFVWLIGGSQQGKLFGLAQESTNPIPATATMVTYVLGTNLPVFGFTIRSVV